MDLNKFLESIRVVPNFFTMNIINISSSKLRTILEKMDDYDDGGDGDDDDRNVKFYHNLSSFLLFLFKYFESSKDKNLRALELHPDNINANVISCVLSFQHGQFTEAERVKEQILETIIQDKYLVAEAKAEVARAYSNMGPSYYNYAITLYEDVISDYPDIYEWKYSLALTIRRCQHRITRTILSVENDVTHNFAKCKSIFEDVIENTDNENIKALSYVGIAALFIKHNTVDVDFNRLGIDVKTIDVVQYLDKAMEVSCNNQQILTETGIVLRDMKKFDTARIILEKAVNIHPTTMNCHHLGLVYTKVEYNNAMAIRYLQQSVDISKCLNSAALCDLGRAYLKSMPSNINKAIGCYNKIIENADLPYVIEGYEMLARCYQELRKQRNISEQQKKEFCQEYTTMNRRHIVHCAIFCMFFGNEDKITHEELFSFDKLQHANYYSNPGNRLKRAIHYSMGPTEFLRDVHIATSSVFAAESCVQKYLGNHQYAECLDLVTILMVTDLVQIEKLAIVVMMDIVLEAIQLNNTELTKSCFTRASQCLLKFKATDAHIRLIYDTTRSDEESNMLETWLTEVGLRVTRNNNDVVAYMDQEEATLTSFKRNIAVICIFKNNNIHLLDEYHIDLLPHGKPVIIPLVVGDSQVSSVIEHVTSMDFPNAEFNCNDKSIWFKNFGLRIFELM